MNAFNNLKVGVRLIGGFLIMTALLLVIGLIGYVNMKTINDGMTAMYTDRTLPIQQLGKADASLFQLRSQVFAVFAITTYRDTLETDTNASMAAFSQAMNDFRKNKLTADENSYLEKLDTNWAAYQKMVAGIVEAFKKNDIEAATALLSDPVNINARKDMDDALNKLVLMNQEAASTAAEDGNKSFNQAVLIQVVICAIGLVLALGLGILLARSITGPLSESVQFLETIAQGDISKDPSTALQHRQDEMGNLARAMLQTAKYLRTNVKDITASAQTLSSSATELSAISEQTTAGAKESSMKSNTVAAAAEEMSTNTVSVAAGMEEATTSLTSVATAVEEMTATIAEIAKNSEKARYTTEQTAQQVNQYATVMRGLGQSAREIGKFTETIASISAQTNLLALNATIEAARAGAAGKGFAVVANEIKELAQQTAAATSEIKNKINDIQVSTADAVGDVEKIVQIIQDVNNSVASTAAAIQEQSTVTQDIARNIAQASTGIKDANTRVAQTAVVSQSIAQDIAGVSMTATQITDASGQIQISAENLSRLAEQLNQLTSQFKV